MDDSKNTSERLPNIKLEIYKTAFQTRNMEIHLFWQRSNYFLVLDTAIAAGFFVSQDGAVRIAICVFGLLVSFLWMLVNFGGKYWAIRWEWRLRQTELELASNGKPGFGLFGASPDEMKKDIGDALELWPSWFWNAGLFRWILLKKPSVSVTMTVLSLLFLIVWLAFLIITCASYASG